VGETEVLRVLLADDEQDMRGPLRFALELDGRFMVVGEADNGEDAVRAAAALQPDAVVLDLALPVLDGMAALPLILDVAGAARVVSGAGDAEDLSRQALALGASAYVQKLEFTVVIAALVKGCLHPVPEEARRSGPR